MFSCITSKWELLNWIPFCPCVQSARIALVQQVVVEQSVLDEQRASRAQASLSEGQRIENKKKYFISSSTSPWVLSGGVSDSGQRKWPHSCWIQVCLSGSAHGVSVYSTVSHCAAVHSVTFQPHACSHRMAVVYGWVNFLSVVTAHHSPKMWLLGCAMLDGSSIPIDHPVESFTDFILFEDENISKSSRKLWCAR